MVGNIYCHMEWCEHDVSPLKTHRETRGVVYTIHRGNGLIQFQWSREWGVNSHYHKRITPNSVVFCRMGTLLERKDCECLCDNAAVVATINSERSKDNKAMHLMRCLTIFFANYGTNIFAEHLLGKHDIL